MNNFYLHRDPDSTRHSLVVWDRDRAFSLLYASVLDRIDENVLARRVLGYEDLFALYLRVLEETARAAADESWLALEIERLWLLAGPAARADTRKRYSNTEFEENVAFLREFAALRPGLVLDEVAAIRAASTSTSR
jgi:hypothetical protein